MTDPSQLVEGSKSLISVLELKRLLNAIKDHRPDVCLRYRILGEMWVPNFTRVLHVRDNTVVFHDERNNKLINLFDISMVMQFEIDAPFQGYQPHYHYNVQPLNG
jgi:hypothetical protein